jgi:UDP-GlcNAc:undecaprenyl-phosphate GlcNAc-1-phosphate transferase
MDNGLANNIWAVLLPIALVAVVAATILIRLLRPYARALGVVDIPGGRKAHTRVTPAVGGIAILLGAVVSLVWADLTSTIRIDWANLAPLGLAIFMMAALGLLDDIRGVAALPKLFVQVAAGGVGIIWAGLQLSHLGAWPSGELIALGVLAIPLTWLGIVGFINALNMMDGIDGLAGGCVVVMLSWIGVSAGLAGERDLVVITAVFSAATAGFLFFNLRTPLRPRASVFLGDCGSLSLGLLIAWLAIEVVQSPTRAVSALGIAWVLVLPVFDTVSLIIRRLLKGQNPLRADRNHLHHLLERAGFSVAQSTLILVGLSLTFGAIGVLGSVAGVPDIVLAGGLIVVLSLHYFFVRYAWRSTRALKRLRFRGAQLRPSHRWALAGFYIAALGLVAGQMSVVSLGIVVLGIGSMMNVRHILGDLRGLTVAWFALGLLAWLTVAALRDANTLRASGLSLVVISGVLALPLGWWLAKLRRHMGMLFLVLALGSLLSVVSDMRWSMLEAGFFYSADHWGVPTLGTAMFAIILMPFIASLAEALTRLQRSWRARAMGVGALSTIVVVLALLIGSESRIAAFTGALGLVVMVISAVLHRLKGALVLSLLGVAGLTVLSAVVLANAFTNTAESFSGAYLSPIQAVVLHWAGQPGLAAIADPAVSGWFSRWEAAWQAIGARPLAGFGTVTEATGWSLYTSVGLIGGGVAVVLLLGLFGSVIRAIAHAQMGKTWSDVWVLASYGVLASFWAFLMFTPLMSAPLIGMLFNLTLALGVAAAVCNQWADDQASRLPARPGDKPLQLVDDWPKRRVG